MKANNWANWSGVVRCTPREYTAPASLGALQALVRAASQAGRRLRVVGAGHSFTPLAASDDLLVSLDNLSGLVSVDQAAGLATTWGGTRLHALGVALHQHGLAQENLGDIDAQSIAGAISTGTHGTGAAFGSIATQVAALTLVTANGELLECSPQYNADLFQAAQVALGTLGVIARVTLRVVPSFRLHYQARREPLAETLRQLDERVQRHRHVEFYWFPYTDQAQIKLADLSEAGPSPSSLGSQFNKIVLENGVFWLLSEACRLAPRLCPAVSKLSALGIANVSETNHSHRVFATPRWVRFNEMEYNLPAGQLAAALEEIRACVSAQRFAVHFPLECRFVHGDNIWLSPAYGRNSGYIAAHMYRGMPYQAYFAALEAILLRYGGRPHWGKLHTLGPAALAERYPRWNDFLRLRAELDPHGLFLNPYLKGLFGL